MKRYINKLTLFILGLVIGFASNVYLKTYKEEVSLKVMQNQLHSLELSYDSLLTVKGVMDSINVLQDSLIKSYKTDSIKNRKRHDEKINIIDTLSISNQVKLLSTNLSKNTFNK